MEIVKYETPSGYIILSDEIIRKQLCNNPKVSDAEIQMFSSLCKYQKLNPFLKEAYLIKYGDAPAQCITAYQAFLQRAELHPQYDGFEQSITYDEKTNLPLTCETKVFRKDRSRPTSWTVKFSEYTSQKSNWLKMPDFMIRKVSLSCALRMAFPVEYQGLYIEEEFEKQNIIQNIPELKEIEENDNKKLYLALQSKLQENGLEIMDCEEYLYSVKAIKEPIFENTVMLKRCLPQYDSLLTKIQNWKT